MPSSAGPSSPGRLESLASGAKVAGPEGGSSAGYHRCTAGCSRLVAHLLVEVVQPHLHAARRMRHVPACQNARGAG